MKLIKIIALSVLLPTLIHAQTPATTPKPKENCGNTANKNVKIKSMETLQKNVLGTELKLASTDPLTGFFRNGFCSTDSKDRGVHVVAAVLTDEFLQYSKSQGNDLITPFPEFGFPGLKAGNTWCLCALRWKEAYDAGVAPPVVLEATNIKALEFVTLKQLQSKKAL